MRHASVSIALMFGLAGPVMAQAADEPRLAGGLPDRICTAADIEAARSGSYFGPPCRFTSDAVDEWAPPSDTPSRNVRSAQVEVSDDAPRTASFPATARYQTARHHPAPTNPLRAYPPAASGRISTSGAVSVSDVRTVHHATETGRTEYRETVQLDAGFFNSAYAGGVAPHPPVYSATSHPVVVYRDTIVIQSDGSARFWNPGYGGIYRAALLPRRIEEQPYRARPVQNGPTSRAFTGPVSRAYRMSNR